MKGELKSAYLARIRNQSSYLTYRAVVNIITVVSYSLACAVAVVGIVIGVKREPWGFFGVPLAAILCIYIRVWQETSLMLVDLADSTLDANSEREEP